MYTLIIIDWNTHRNDKIRDAQDRQITITLDKMSTTTNDNIEDTSPSHALKKNELMNNIKKEW